MEACRCPHLTGVLREGWQMSRQQELGRRSAKVSETVLARRQPLISLSNYSETMPHGRPISNAGWEHHDCRTEAPRPNRRLQFREATLAESNPHPKC